MILDVEDHEVDADLPLLAGRTARYVTEPHGWPVDRMGRVSASKGRLTVVLHGDGRIEDDEYAIEDDATYGVPSSAAEARALAALYEEAEDILAAYREVRYVPPAELPPYIDRRVSSFTKDTWLPAMAAQMMSLKMSSLMNAMSPYEPVTRQERFRNIWRRMHGLEPLPRREKRPGGKLVWHYD